MINGKERVIEVHDILRHTKKLSDIQNKRIKAMKYSTPLDDIFCVYSMYWRPKKHG